MNKVQTFAPNFRGRDLVVGDMHGQLPMFLALLSKANFDPTRDRVFSVGDLIDRGPDPLGCLALLREDWFHGVIGNHEDMMIRTAAGRPTAWAVNGGRWWLSCTAEERESAVRDAQRASLAIVVHCMGDQGQVGRFNVVHAEFPGSDHQLDEHAITKDLKESMLWGRDLIGGFGFETTGLSTTYVGHSIVDQVRRIGSHVFIDTGAYLPQGRLTMIEPMTGNTWEVEH